MFASLSLEVIDPCNRTGKISIPMQHVVGTKGVSDFHTNPAKRDGKELSLCLLFQKGRCNAGSKCHQVHAAPDYIAALRQQVSAVKNCCSCHGDVHSAGYASMSNAFVTLFSNSISDDSSLMAFPLSAFARTSFLDAALRSASSSSSSHGGCSLANRAMEPPASTAATMTIRVPAAKVCRLHSQGRCKFGKDCKNIHLCPEATPVAAPLTIRHRALADHHPSSPPLPAHPNPCQVVPKIISPPAAVDAAAVNGLSPKSSQESTPRMMFPTRDAKMADAASSSAASTTTTASATSFAATSTRSVRLDSTSMQELSSCISSTWGLPSPQFDMSGFEDTIRCLCLDLTSAPSASDYQDDPLTVFSPVANRV
jgi:hypothetical protein